MANNIWLGRTARKLRSCAMRILLSILAIAIGVAAVVLGEADDSPGLQGLGVLLIVGTVALGVRTAQRGT